ncbi:MAG: flagellar filament capping protein FliD [Betaproteobacteria bacterium]|nr:flagellar filament capping protein FliD [Betaproteobacteria bacterium]
MATISSAAGAIDVQGIVSQLMSIERQPLQALQTTATGISTKLSAVGRVQGALSNLQSAARDLTSLSNWQQVSASSSDETAVKATSSTGAVPGVYDVTVNQLAQRQTLASSSFSGSDAVIGGGTLSIQLGTYNSGTNTFTGAGSAVNVTVAAGSTLSQVRDAINATTGTGVSASIVDDGNGSRLVLRSSATGAKNSISMTVVDGDGSNTDSASGLSRLAYDPTKAAGSGKNLTQTQAAQDASVTISGLTVTSSTNTVSGAIENVSLDLRKAGTGNVNITVSTNTTAMRGIIDKFVNAWNETNSNINVATAYNAETKVAGPLQGNNTFIGLQRQLRSTLSSSLSSGDLTRLSDAGIELQRDGSLRVNSTRLDPFLATPEKLKYLFANSSSTDNSLNGIARKMDTLITGVLGSGGAIPAAQDALRSRQTQNTDAQASLKVRLAAIEKRLTDQYSAVNKNISEISGAATSLLSKFG